MSSPMRRTPEGLVVEILWTRVQPHMQPRDAGPLRAHPHWLVDRALVERFPNRPSELSPQGGLLRRWGASHKGAEMGVHAR